MHNYGVIYLFQDFKAIYRHIESGHKGRISYSFKMNIFLFIEFHPFSINSETKN